MRKNSSTYRYKSMNKRWIWIILSIVILVSLGVAAIYFLSTDFFYHRMDIPVSVFTTSEDTKTAVEKASFSADSILAATKKTMVDKLGTAPFAVSWYLLPGSVSTQKSSSSAYIMTNDQVLLLQAYVACDKKDEANALIAAIESQLTDASGLLKPYITANPTSQSTPNGSTELEEELPSSEPSYSDTLQYERALLLYYQKWGHASDMDRIKKYADALLSAQGEYLTGLKIAAPTPTPVSDQILKDNPQIAKENADKEEIYSYIPLYSLDLDTLKMLSSMDPRFTDLLNEATSICSEGRISDQLPLYAEGYDPSLHGYLYVTDKETSADPESSLETAVHSVGVIELPTGMTSWLKEELLNRQNLSSRYDVISGDATSKTFSYPSYPLALRLGIRTDDAVLCAAALSPMEQSLVTNTKSEAKGMFFRTVLTNRIAVYARENLLAVLALAESPEN